MKQEITKHEVKSNEKKEVKFSKYSLVVTLLVMIALALVPVAYFIGVSNGKTESDNNRRGKEQTLKKPLEKTPRPAQYLSGKLRRGSSICWNNDVELTGFDVKPNGETSLKFKSGGKTINRKYTFGEKNAPIPGNMGNLIFTVIRPKAHISLINWADNFEFEATYEPFVDVEKRK